MENEDEEVFIRVSLVDTSHSPHAHKLAYKEANSGVWKTQDCAEIMVSSQSNFKAMWVNNLIKTVGFPLVEISSLIKGSGHSHVKS